MDQRSAMNISNTEDEYAMEYLALSDNNISLFIDTN